MRELRLLLACGHLLAHCSPEAEIHRLLDEGIDWTAFARKAVDHGMAGMAAHNLLRIAPAKVPAEIRDALLLHLEQNRQSNGALLEELARILDAVENAGIETIPFKGPVLALCAYGDLGLRAFRDLDILVHDADLPATISVLRDLGYRRGSVLSEAQIEMIQHLQGQETLYGGNAGIAIEPHTRLTSIKMVLDIDYSGLWRRAKQADLNGHRMRILEPEDVFLVLAIHGGKELWWNIKWACDIAVFLESNANLNWTAIIARAKAQGCLRMALLAAELARSHFGAVLPDGVSVAIWGDSGIERMGNRIAQAWLADSPAGPPRNSKISIDRLRLHDGIARRIRYATRTLFLPTPAHVAAFPLPRNLSFAYVPIKIVHDSIALPLWLAFCYVSAKIASFRKWAERFDVAQAMLPSSKMGRLEYRAHRIARARAKQALSSDPNNSAAWSDLGDALSGLKHHGEALCCYDKALSIRPESAKLWRKRDAALAVLGRAPGYGDFPIEIPGDANLWAMRAGFYFARRRYNEAIAASDSALAIDPHHRGAIRIGIHARLWACNWDRRGEDKSQISAGFEAGYGLIGTIDLRRICPAERDNFLAAQLWARAFPPSPNPLWKGERYEHGKIRIAYMSSDFRDHVVSEAMIGLLEQHDRTLFEVTAVSLGPDDGSEMRVRIEAAFDRFIDARHMSDAEAAKTIRDMESDIVIDLNGYAGAHRTGILAHRPAPLQINYLGFPGTMAAPFIDYMIADRVVVPNESRRFYSERLIYLPHTYMPTDNRRKIAEKRPSRADAGLPENGVVFACHHDERKISPEMFHAWLRLLHRVEGSILWLKSLNPSAVTNLRREARASGIAPERIVFAPRLPRSEDHLARLALADLFLDTLPYNAHATACDALWAGVPVLTCRGEAFPGRVGASVLHAAGLPELVTSSVAEYEELARALAQNPARLGALKAKLARAKCTQPLFDTTCYTRYLESAYIAMIERHRSGLAPADLTIPIFAAPKPPIACEMRD